MDKKEIEKLQEILDTENEKEFNENIENSIKHICAVLNIDYNNISKEEKNTLTIYLRGFAYRQHDILKLLRK